MKYDKHIMIDIETAATSHDALVLSVGVTEFMPYKEDIFKGTNSTHTNLSLAEQLLAGRRADPKTCKWWAKQSPEAINVAWWGEVRMQVPVLHDMLSRYFPTGQEIIWANGIDFDLTILESLLKDFNLSAPWHHKNKRCMRTLREIKGVQKISRAGTHHDALDDAEYQAHQVAAYLKHVNKDFLFLLSHTRP